ncbi:hypothetical protein GTQ34_16130 [Muricauda sp. JGD-17]|uniref:Uncharacterized protein n=1 Tax=Flagellimonas ochracea TaxID=2696472 RepID=A0A964TEM2_9FLAO|nr:hypothetical protein [Allomuricauda ochracea]NAY93440.1 hypothetical protein [Allomuricauda ochracea]
MKIKTTVLILLLTSIVLGCSKGESPEPDLDQQEDTTSNPESNIEDEDAPIVENPMEEEMGNIPFSISVILRTSNGSLNGGEYYTMDFVMGEEKPRDPFNISQSIGLSSNVALADNGKEDILLFLHTDPVSNIEDRTYSAYNLTKQEVKSGSFRDFFPDSDECFWNVNQIGCNENKIFTFENDVCSNEGNIRIRARDIESGEVEVFPLIENAYAGDSGHRMLLTDRYFVLQYDDRSPEAINSIKDGLVIYDANTYEEVLSLNGSQAKQISIDDDLLFVATQPNTIEILDLNTGNPVYAATTDSFLVDWTTSVTKESISDGRVSGVREEAILVPVYYDIAKNETVDVNRDPYFAFFNRDTIDFTADVIIPQQFKFDMASERFAISYYTFDPGANTPKSIGLVFMDFDGTVLFKHELPDFPLIPDRIIRR